MTYRFAALRFCEDGNICDRVYWYLSDFPLKEGDAVLAPVGARNGLQYARVERVISATEETAPYNPRLCKRVTAKYGARKIEAGGVPCYELGGVKFDEKHYTKFGRILISSQEELGKEARAALKEYGVTRIVFVPESGEFIDEERGGCVLFAGMGAANIAKRVLSAVHGEEETKEINALAQTLLR